MQDSRNDRCNFSLKSVHIYEVCPESIQLPVAHSSCLLNHLNSFHGGMFMLSAKLDADSLLYSLSCFECYGHGVHMLTQQCLPPPLTSTVKLSLFTHAHSGPLSLAARLHLCCTCCTIHSHPIAMAGLFLDRPHVI